MSAATLPVHASPFTAEQTRAFIDAFNRDGYVHLGNLLSPEECDAVQAGIDKAFADPRGREEHRIYSDFVCVRLFETDRLFRDMLAREPIISLMEALLGSDCHLIATNAVRNRSGEAIARFHVDDPSLLLHLPPDIPRIDPRITIPTMLLNVQIAVTDIPSVEYGPTQAVPGSHYSGREPSDPTNPVFEGRGPVSIFCRRGDVYLQHPLVWHRGAPNTSDRTRYLYQIAYGRRSIAQRFFPFLNYRVPDHVLDGADERILRLLGKHAKGAWG